MEVKEMVRIEEDESHDSDTEEKIFKKYIEIYDENKCTTKCKNICANAKKDLKIKNNGFPTSLFVVGKKYKEQNPKILFVGKTLKGNWEKKDEGTEATYILNNNEKPIFIDITKDLHEEISFKSRIKKNGKRKGIQHIDDILRKCFKKHLKYKNEDEIESIFKNKNYPQGLISCVQKRLEKNKYDSLYNDLRTKTINILDNKCEDYKNIMQKNSSPHLFGKSCRYILSKVYDIDNDDELWRNAAITNAVKCSVSGNNDETPEKMIKNCILENGYIKAEIEQLMPTHVIFFTAGGDDRYIKYIDKMGVNNFDYENINNIETRLEYGPHTGTKIGSDKKGQQKKVPWWYRVFYDKSNNIKMHLLVTRHPEHAKNEWKDEVVAWIRETNKISKLEDINKLKSTYE